MFERLPRLDAAVDRAAGPVTRFLHRRLGVTPAQATWSSFAASVLAAVTIARGHLYAGLALMAVGQAIDHFDGAIAREFGLASLAGARLDTAVDRLSEGVIFSALVFAGLVPLKLALLAFTAIILLTSVSERSRLDPGFKRFVLYLGPWVAYSKLFVVIFAANLIGYVVGLLILDIQFQHRMDALGGDLDTVASRAAESEATERQPVPAPRSA
jgi:phosphatidylglycerophosphate synthase